MGNVPPRGLYGWPKEGTGSTPAPATQVFTARPDGTWCAADEVYEWCETSPGVGAWLPVWTAVPRAAGVATATKLGGGWGGGPISVKVDWTAPAPRTADSWRIVRPDGTIAGVVAYDVLTFTDTDPRPAPTGGQYKVIPLNSGVTGPQVLTNALVLGAAPAVTTATLNPGAGYRIDLGPGGAHAANSTAFRFYRPAAGSPFFDGPLAPGQLWYDASPNPGQVGQYKACAMVNGREGGCSLFPSVTTRPAPPRPQWTTRGSTGGVDGKVSFGFWGPAVGSASDYHVQVYAAGAWRDLGYGYLGGVVSDYNVQVWGGGGYVTEIQFRVATRLNGVESEWAYGATINPYAPPQTPSLAAANLGSSTMGIYAYRAGGGPPVTGYSLQIWDQSGGPNGSGCAPSTWCLIGVFPEQVGLNIMNPYPYYWNTRGNPVYVLVALVGPGGYSPSVQAGPVNMS